ncbi:MAG: hypothetical protein ACRDRT_09915, partial [Pseudonocardiaceae bacterium]
LVGWARPPLRVRLTNCPRFGSNSLRENRGQLGLTFRTYRGASSSHCPGRSMVRNVFMSGRPRR